MLPLFLLTGFPLSLYLFDNLHGTGGVCISVIAGIYTNGIIIGLVSGMFVKIRMYIKDKNQFIIHD